MVTTFKVEMTNESWEEWEARAIANKDEAMRFVLTCLRSPLMLLSIPQRELATKLCTLHSISALDLVTAATTKARNA